MNGKESMRGPSCRSRPFVSPILTANPEPLGKRGQTSLPDALRQYRRKRSANQFLQARSFLHRTGGLSAAEALPRERFSA
ncbi:hypothetical protein D3C76_1803900 [compost metagenome]